MFRSSFSWVQHKNAYCRNNGGVKKVNKFENLDRDRFKQQYHGPTTSSCNIPDSHLQQLLSRQGLSKCKRKRGPFYIVLRKVTRRIIVWGTVSLLPESCRLE